MSCCWKRACVNRRSKVNSDGFIYEEIPNALQLFKQDLLLLYDCENTKILAM